MFTRDTLRRLRAIALNGVAWGGAWFFGVMTMATTANLIDGRGFLIDGWELAVPGGILFAVTGVAFSTVITLVLRGRTLAELSWMRFGLGGGAVSFLFLPTLISALRVISGDDMLGLSKLLGTGSLGFLFGGMAAAGSLTLAQLADRHLLSQRASAPALLTEESMDAQGET
ncbi:MAG: hypothetical protein P3B98_04105 [Gemmatimonadota bacterium]|nr:hypothetical protein [Gemmatimonadota bacterium]